MRKSRLFSLLLCLLVSQAFGQITWHVPEDGGTPRDPARIERVGTNEFRIRAMAEEDGPSVLRHAVSRLDLFCRNESQSPIRVTLHLDLSGDGQRTDYNTRPEGGMPSRDFIFIQSPGKTWRQVDGTTQDWTSILSFEALPGETKVGLSPWYTYGDYLAFVSSLPQHPHLAKKLLGKSDGGREHLELIITDPGVSLDKKQTIFWHAREHAYESWSSFALEGLVDYLLSGAAADFRRRYIIVLHPMTNVDGVAQGFEYRGGYDYPKPRGTATARLTFEAMDRLQPAYAVAWHNWVAPRDRNVVFYTDGENGQPTARAWLRFTQLFPSLRRAGHRWNDENSPLKYNWHGRSLSEANVHQYAMKKYGTRVWGWEMPWWNCTVDEARQSGADFGRAFLTTIEELRTESVPAAVERPAVEVPRWEIHEFSVKGRSLLDNPFQDAVLVGEFTSPSGKTNVVDGFYDGDNTWRLRFAPEETGEWRYLLRGEGLEVLQQGLLRCVAPRSHGFIRIHPENPYAFAYADGRPFFPMGDTCYGLHDDSPISPELRAEYLKTRRAQRFNFVRMSVGHSHARALKDPAFWAWGGTALRPDLDRLNPVFFRSLDTLLRQMRESGMNAEMILLNFYRFPFTDPRLWTPARERLWLRYLVARYAAFDNIFLWTLANEYETHPDGQYRLDFPGDVEWARQTARFIKSNDPYRHLVTVHPVISASRRGASPRDLIDPPWRIGEFFGEDDALSVISQQTGAMGEGTAWDQALQCWTGDDQNLVVSLRTDRRFRKPVLNTESGYEYLRDHPTEKKQVHHTDKVRRSAWRIVCAGGYFAAGFHGTIGHSDIWNRIDAPNHYTFVLKDEGAASQLGALYDFFTDLPYWRMQPFTNITGEAVALAEEGKTYVLYLPRGGSTILKLPSDIRLHGHWFNPRIGKFDSSVAVEARGSQELKALDTNDWAILLKPVQ